MACLNQVRVDNPGQVNAPVVERQLGGIPLEQRQLADGEVDAELLCTPCQDLERQVDTPICSTFNGMISSRGSGPADAGATASAESL